MGDIISGVIGGIGSLIGGNKQKQADAQGAQQSLAGFNYLTGKNGVGGYVQQGQGANQAGGAVTDQTAAMLNGNNPSAMSNYLKSTGYNFQMQQGQNAITGNAASRGLLGSGATAKALTTFGTGLAGQSFNNYLNQRGAVASQYDATAQRGVSAAGEIGQAGTAGGANAGNLTAQGGAAAGGAAATTGGILQSSGVGNFLSNTIGKMF